MLRDTLVATLAGKLGQRDDLDEVIIAEMQFAQEFRLEQNGNFTPWFMLSEDATIDTTPGERRVVLPSDFIKEDEETPFTIYSPSAQMWIPLVKDSTFRFDVNLSGLPCRYSIRGEYFILDTVPDSVYTIKTPYYGKQPALTTNIENNWLKYAGDLMLADVGTHIAKQELQNIALAESFNQQRMSAWERLLKHHEARTHERRQYRMGG
jgi:hypothetical protein